ncbi:cationic amino acid transporter 1-like [Prosopis cineraria]|uniref:cationic amino acid transporter 1-like n=1 Tax=Prosopis cineraria TaxID=364024 RepID=UPI002410013B|nr:cationic amino acid transporter 1-like [Prosopis cineraria]
MAKETKNPGRDIPLGLVGSMTITTLRFCLLAVTLCMQKNSDIDDKGNDKCAAYYGPRVNQGTRKPINAAVIMISATAIIAFFIEFQILGELLSISTLFLLSLMALAL